MDAESLSDSSTLPEISFEDLLVETPIKKLPTDIYSNDNDLVDEAQKSVDDEMLNTPGPKVQPKQEDQSLKSLPSNTDNSLKLQPEELALQQTSMPSNTATTIQLETSDTATASTTIATDQTVTLTTSSSASQQSISSSSAATSVPILLNSKIALSKTNVIPQTVVKIATTPRIISAATTSAAISTASGTATEVQTKAKTFSTVTTIDGKTALKTSNGQIVYIQKGQSTGGIGSIRIKNVSALPTAAAAAAPTSQTGLAPVKVSTIASGANAKFVTTTTSATANIGGNKTVIQLIRSADGKLMPLKTTTASGKSTLTIPTTIAAHLAGKKIITASGGQVVIKTAAPTMAATGAKQAGGSASTDSTTAAETLVSAAKPIKIQKIMAPSSLVSSATTTTTTSTTQLPTAAAATAEITENVVGSSVNADIGMASTAGGKIFVQGTQMVVPNSSQFIKLSPQIGDNPIKTIVSATTTSNNTTANGNVAKSSNTTNSGTQMSGALHAIQIPGKPGLQYVRVFSAPKKSTVASTSATTTTSTTVTAMPKLLNSLPPKYTVVRPNNGAKIILTQSPKSDGSPVLSPIAAGKLKTIVTVPTIRSIFSSNDSPSISSSSSVGTSAPPTASSNNASSDDGTSDATASGMLRPKTKISEINSEIQRMTASGGDVKKVVSGPDGKRYLIMPRSLLRTAQIPVSSAVQNRSEAHQKQEDTPQHQQQQMKLLNVVKTGTIASANASEGGMKSFVICKSAQTANTSFKSVSIKKPTQQSQSQQSKSILERKEEEKIKISENGPPSSAQNNNNNNKFLPIKIKQEPLDNDDLSSLMFADDAMVRGGVRRKHCNCSKSQCLKLYCDCFANGEFCHDCTCKDCFNNLQYEDERQRAIKSCLERNPSAFKPKITTSHDQGDTRLHNKGCNCKRSGCLKNYCECFEAKIPCSSNCKCVGCRNVEDRPDLDLDPIDPKLLESIANASNATNTIARAVSTSNQLSSFAAGVRRTYEKAFSKREVKSESDTFDEHDLVKALGTGKRPHIDEEISGTAALLASPQLGDGADEDDGVSLAEKRNANFITQEVIDATIQCMISQADECLKNNLPAPQIEKMVLEELGRCLVEIIDFSIRNTETSFSQN